MKLVVLAGSPKGEESVTMQYVHYIKSEFPQHEYVEFHVAHKINHYEKNRPAFDEVIAAVRAADAVLWAFPLYVCLAAAQYKRFIELIGERGAQDAFRDKYTASLTTSIHFFDDTAHEYMRAVAEDLGMKYVGRHSPDMFDLVHRKGRRQTRLFAEQLFSAVAEQWPTPRRYFPAVAPKLQYRPGKAGKPVDTHGKKILIVHDATDPQSNLARMIDRLQQAFGGTAEVVNLHDIDLKGGCLGCLQCGYDNTCIYQGKDGNNEFHDKKIAPAEIVVFGGNIVDRYLSSRWKLFYDRAFFHNHVPWMTGKHFGWVISGSLSQNANLHRILQCLPEMQGANLTDMVTDEAADSKDLDRQLDTLALRLVRQAEEKWAPAPMGPIVGGRKIFRDAVYESLRLVFHADHVYYKAHNHYDFPQKKYRQRLFLFAMEKLLLIPSFRQRFYKKEMNKGMMQPLRRAVSGARK